MNLKRLLTVALITAAAVTVSTSALAVETKPYAAKPLVLSFGASTRAGENVIIQPDLPTFTLKDSETLYWKVEGTTRSGQLYKRRGRIPGRVPFRILDTHGCSNACMATTTTLLTSPTGQTTGSLVLKAGTHRLSFTFSSGLGPAVVVWRLTIKPSS